MFFGIENLEFLSKDWINYFNFFFIRLLFEKKVNVMQIIVMYVVSFKFQGNVVWCSFSTAIWKNVLLVKKCQENSSRKNVIFVGEPVLGIETYNMTYRNFSLSGLLNFILEKFYRDQTSSTLKWQDGERVRSRGGGRERNRKWKWVGGHTRDVPGWNHTANVFVYFETSGVIIFSCHRKQNNQTT